MIFVWLTRLSCCKTEDEFSDPLIEKPNELTFDASYSLRLSDKNLKPPLEMTICIWKNLLKNLDILKFKL